MQNYSYSPKGILTVQVACVISSNSIYIYIYIFPGVPDLFLRTASTQLEFVKVVCTSDFSIHVTFYSTAAQQNSNSLASSESAEVVHCLVQNAAVSCENICDGLTQFRTNPFEERRRKNIWQFANILVQYFRDALSCHEEFCWS